MILIYQEISELLNYDVVEFIRGNPYYLLNSLRNKNAKDVLYKIAVDKILIGWSAGTLVMGPSISIIEKYIPEMNTCKNLNLTGLCLTYVQILPHYSGPVKKYSNCEKLCHEYECSNKCFVIRISDGEEALINMVDKKVTIIKG